MKQILENNPSILSSLSAPNFWCWSGCNQQTAFFRWGYEARPAISFSIGLNLAGLGQELLSDIGRCREKNRENREPFGSHWQNWVTVDWAIKGAEWSKLSR